eukprot:PhM_4_TR9746/c4_g3_i1/m.99887
MSVAKISHKDEHVLGAGACGVVYRGLVEQPGPLDLRVGQLVAVKRIPIIASSVGKVAAKKVEQEVALLQSLTHENIVRYFGTVREDHALSIVMEYAEGGSLHTLYRDFGSLAEPIVKSFTVQMLRGLAFLHSKNVIHRDIKSMNVLLDKSGHIMLADFGCSVDLSALAEKKFKSMTGSLPWMAPEVINMTSSEGAGTAADIWSLGCTVWEMLSGRIPFSDFDSEFHMMCHIATCEEQEELLEPIDEIMPDALSFIFRCLKRKPEDRPSAAELLQDPWLADFLEVQATTTSTPMSTPVPKVMPPPTAKKSKMTDARQWWTSAFGESAASIPASTFITHLQCDAVAPRILPFLIGGSIVTDLSMPITRAAFENFVQWFGPFTVLKGALGGNKSRCRAYMYGGGEYDSSAGYKNFGPGYGYGYGTEGNSYEYGDGYHYATRYPTHVLRMLDSSWFHPFLKKEQCDLVMSRCTPGTFCIRLTSNPTEYPGGFTLSLRGDSSTHHFRVNRPHSGWEFLFRNGDQDLSFKALNEMIEFFQTHDIISQKHNKSYRLVKPFEK